MVSTRNLILTSFLISWNTSIILFWDGASQSSAEQSWTHDWIAVNYGTYLLYWFLNIYVQHDSVVPDNLPFLFENFRK